MHYHYILNTFCDQQRPLLSKPGNLLQVQRSFFWFRLRVHEIQVRKIRHPIQLLQKGAVFQALSFVFFLWAGELSLLVALLLGLNELSF
jgi:hypothetical protein